MELIHELNEIRMRNYIGDMIWINARKVTKGQAFRDSVTDMYTEMVNPSVKDTRSAEQIYHDLVNKLQGSD